jgi:hypothetical protein
MISTALSVSAQNQPSDDFYWNLVKKNAASIGLNSDDLKNVRISDAYYDGYSKAYMVYLQQTYRSVDVENTISPIVFKDGRLITHQISTLKNFSVEKDNATPSVNAQSALTKAATALNLHPVAAAISLKNSVESHTQEFGTLGISYNNIPVKLLWTNTNTEQPVLKLAWEVLISSSVNNALWRVLVDAQTGTVISKKNLTVYERPSGITQKPHEIFVYEDEPQSTLSDNEVHNIKSINSSNFNVIPYPDENRFYGGPALTADPWTNNQNQNANTLKWNNDSASDYTILRGNNVYVQDDHDKNDKTFGYSPNSSTPVPNLNFNFTPDFYSEPTDTFNVNFNFTNLFYWTNLMHDLSYQYGFNEISGNFQKSNLNRGGQGNDFVIEDAQDSSGFNNANFSTPADGSSPRMQMYLFDPSFIRHFHINSPLQIAGDVYGFKDAVSKNNSFLKTGPVTADIILFNDQQSGTTHSACNTAANAAALKNKIAYIDRGSCSFVTKFLNAQSAGAAGIIVANFPGNDTLIQMGGDSNTIIIPGVFIGGTDGTGLKSFLSNSITVNGTLYGPEIDGEIDNTIPTHEYTHGISNRLVGGPQNVTCLQNLEQMGEGWSDWYALMITQNWPASSVSGDHNRTIGSYASGYDTVINVGIRTYPYSTSIAVNPWTYDSLARLRLSGIPLSPDPHTVGEIWCEMLWNLTWKLVDDYGIGNNIFNSTQTGGNNIALSLITEGLKLTSCSPGFVDGRDGILKADTTLYGGKYSNEIWRVFASRGLGYSAKQGNSNSTRDGIAAYDLPPGVLAAVFENFTAQKQGNTALLKWSTAQESNTSRFIVERTTDARTFTPVGQVKAAGNSVVMQNYQFTDANPVKGDNMYRIKEMDNDGKYTLSELRSLNFGDRPSIIISPNPATNIVTINIPGNNQALKIKLFSNSGQSINNYTMNNETLSIDVSRLASGVYNIVIEGNGYSSKYKLVVR